MKPLEVSLEEMKDVLGVLDAVEDDGLGVAEQFAPDLRREVPRRKELAGC